MHGRRPQREDAPHTLGDPRSLGAPRSDDGPRIERGVRPDDATGPGAGPRADTGTAVALRLAEGVPLRVALDVIDPAAWCALDAAVREVARYPTGVPSHRGRACSRCRRTRPV